MTSTTPEEKLKPCLRCGGILRIHENDWATPSMWSFRCDLCGLSGKEWPNKPRAIADANRRSPSRREVLEEAARKIREVSADWELDGQWQKVAAAEYLESCIRALAEEE